MLTLGGLKNSQYWFVNNLICISLHSEFGIPNLNKSAGQLKVI